MTEPADPLHSLMALPPDTPPARTSEASRRDPALTPPRSPSSISQPVDAPDPYRVEALQAAAHWHMGSTVYPEETPDPAGVIAVARVFEAYLRGNQ